MKILTRKKQDEVLQRLTANAIIIFGLLEGESMKKKCENDFEIATIVGGNNGCLKMCQTVRKWIEEEENKC